MTVADAISAAGGFSTNRTITGVEIIRIVDGEKQTLGVSLTDPVLAGDSIVVR
jgi:protein involved in polysaccharide export with SLBB domain